MRCTVKDNQKAGRFELEEAGQMVFARYRRMQGVIYIDYVEAPPALRGTGAAGRLMQGMMQLMQAEGASKVVPICGYAAAWLARHPEFSDITQAGPS